LKGGIIIFTTKSIVDNIHNYILSRYGLKNEIKTIEETLTIQVNFENLPTDEILEDIGDWLIHMFETSIISIELRYNGNNI